MNYRAASCIQEHVVIPHIIQKNVCTEFMKLLNAKAETKHHHLPYSNYLIIFPFSMAAIWRLICYKHIIEAVPCEGWDRLCVVLQMSNEALFGWLGNVEHQKRFVCFTVFCIQYGCRQRAQDELVYFQDEWSHEGSLRSLVRNCSFDLNWKPSIFTLQIKKQQINMWQKWMPNYGWAYFW